MVFGLIRVILFNSFIFNWIILPTAIAFGIKFYIKKSRTRHDITNEVDVTGKTVIITGASDGIGKVTAQELSRRGAKVILACRNLKKAETAVADIRKSTGNGELIVMHLNLSSLASVHKFAAEFISSPHNSNGLSILINNAGLVHAPGVLNRTEDGFEEHMGVNHLGHFLLTNLLLPELEKAAKSSKDASRIVNVSSGGHRLGELNFHDLNYHKTPIVEFKFLQYVSKLYCHSKLANVLFNMELGTRLREKKVNVNSYALCPGLVSSNIFTETSQVKPNLIGLLIEKVQSFLIMKNVVEGTETTLHCALSKYLEYHSGEMYRNCTFWDQSQRLRVTEEDAALLWEKSAELVGL